MTANSIVVTDAPERERFEAHLDGELAGFAAYQKAGSIIVFTHTEVQPVFEGRGIGGELVRQSLDLVRAAGTHRVLPICPFVRDYIGRHQEYADLVYTAPRSTATE